MTDFLTGFPNRRYAMERIEQEWASATRSNRSLACLVIDLDEFKRINDAHGHDVGDVVLRQASIALKRGLRAHDVISRTGGDEFLVICPDTTLTAAIACAERVRKSVASTTVVAGNVEIHPSISVGVAVREEVMLRRRCPHQVCRPKSLPGQGTWPEQDRRACNCLLRRHSPGRGAS